MTAVSRRLLADIDRNVQYPPFYAAHQLTLCKRGALKMQPAHNTVAGHTLVVLDEVYLAYLLVELSLRKTLEKVTSRILEYYRLDNDQALDRRLNYLHG